MSLPNGFVPDALQNLRRWLTTSFSRAIGDGLQVFAFPVVPSCHERMNKDKRYPLKGWVIVPVCNPNTVTEERKNSCDRTNCVTIAQAREILKIDLVELFNTLSEGLKCPGVVLCAIQPGV